MGLRNFLKAPAPVPFGFGRLFCAAVLLGAAALKTHELLTVPTAAISMPWGWSLALVQLELAMGLVILLAPSPIVAWFFAVLVFGVLALVAAAKWAAGLAHCGCFGRLAASPWQSLLVDVAALTFLALSRPPFERSRVQGVGPMNIATTVQLPGLALLWFLVAFPLAAAVAALRPAPVSDNGLIAGAGDLIVLEPDKWRGRRWPLFDYIDRGEELSAGRWQVVLYHHDCPKCHSLLTQLAALPDAIPLPEDNGRKNSNAASVARLALIELPPFGDFVGDVPENAQRAQLSDAKEWFVETPVVLTLDGGVVEESRSAN